MSASKRHTKKSRRYISIPHHVLESNEYIGLDGNAVRLLIDILWQYHGKNNGELTASHDLLGLKRRWPKTSLYRARRKLINKGFVIITKHGAKVRGDMTMLAITWNGIDKPEKVKYDHGIEISVVPLNLWLKNNGN